MAVKIISSPRNIAVKFKCECGCEFYADQYDMNPYTKDHYLWCSNCPDCGKLVVSKESPVPSWKVLNVFDLFNNWVREREEKKFEVEKMRREQMYILSKHYFLEERPKDGNKNDESTL